MIKHRIIPIINENDTIAITELMFLAKEIIGMDYKTNEALFLLMLFYLIVLLPLSIFVRYLEKRQRRASYGI